MNFHYALGKSSVIRNEHRESLVTCLRKIPDFSWLIGAPNRYSDRLQGYFFSDFPVVYLKADGQPRATRKPAMLINNSCDLPPGRNPMVTVALVLDFGQYLKFLERKKLKREAIENHARDVRRNQIGELLYVPNFSTFSDGAIVRLDQLCSVAYGLLEEAIQNGRRIASFTQSGFYVLLLKLTHHLTRSESAEMNRLE